MFIEMTRNDVDAVDNGDTRLVLPSLHRAEVRRGTRAFKADFVAGFGIRNVNFTTYGINSHVI